MLYLRFTMYSRIMPSTLFDSFLLVSASKARLGDEGSESSENALAFRLALDTRKHG
jgi:hypothetical protein